MPSRGRMIQPTGLFCGVHELPYVTVILDYRVPFKQFPSFPFFDVFLLLFPIFTLLLPF